ncbi:DUF5630 domain-containing protein [Legionella quateirensis]|uniref:Ankyrin repeat protein n=1 Tax=Legionella quateirensis TaxID=45072 RepID=A0A378KRZ6_9GAMM|nr:DUF5630 domain-containing protein [Legionella quateirensis]KTD43657.1 Ankyrin repeat protein [Legionella quateirensis]STY17355.1 Ankyrin repeat protein [Legionella quateirensis]
MKEKSTTQGKVVSFLTNNHFDKAIKILEQWNDGQLADFLFSHTQLHPKLKEPQYNQFWERRRTNLRLPGNPEFRFMAQPGIHDSDFVMGYLLYLLQLKSKTTQSPDGVSFIGVNATDYLSFHSIRTYLHQIFINLRNASEADLIKIAEFLFNLESFAKKHQCPGYLLMANGYMQLALCYQNLRMEEQCRAGYILCWKFLHLASLTESDSEESINNAYFGKGIVLSTPFKLASIDEMKKYCIQAADSYLSHEDRIGAEKAGLSMYHHTPVLREPDEGIRPSFGI